MTDLLFCHACGAALSSSDTPCSHCGQLPQSSPAQQLTRESELVPGSLLLQRYRIAKKIGEGGFGLVYKAWDKQERRHVAIKQITLAALNAREMIEATDSYNREITILPRLHHYHLPELYDHFTDPGHWYIVMQYIDGETLEERLAEARTGRLAVGEVIYIGSQLCEVLGYLHRQEPPVIFRDVKPANIMVSRKNGDIYLIDFGIARRYRAGQNRDTRPLGSPGYAAPEQYGRAQSSPYTDMYGLGATLQTLLTGKEPPEIQAEGVPADCKIPSELQSLLAQMLEPYPEKRPKLMSSVEQSLRKLQTRYPRPSFSPTRKTTPPPPLAWLAVLWMLFALLSLYPITVLFIPQFNYSTTFVLEILLITALISAVIIKIIYRFFRTSRASVGEMKRRKIYIVLKDSLVSSFDWVTLLSLYIYLFFVYYALRYFNIKLLAILIIYLAITITGVIFIAKGWLPFLKRAKQTQTTSQGQQSGQEVLVQQRVRRAKK